MENKTQEITADELTNTVENAVKHLKPLKKKEKLQQKKQPI